MGAGEARQAPQEGDLSVFRHSFLQKYLERLVPSTDASFDVWRNLMVKDERRLVPKQQNSTAQQYPLAIYSGGSSFFGEGIRRGVLR